MPRKLQKRVPRVVVRHRAREPAREAREAVRHYREAVRHLREADERRRDALGRGERDDLPKVRIPTPIVKPKGISREQIRKAVRKAVLEYSERHAKAVD